MNISIRGNVFELTFPFDMDIINKVRDIPGRKWKPEGKYWVVPATAWHAHRVLQDFPFAEISEDIRKMANPSAKLKLRFPKGLYEFQKDGVRFIVNTGGRCIIADEMGLGKTIEALSYIKMFGSKALIIAPSNVLFKWEMECKKWVGERTCKVYTSGKGGLGDEDIHIMSYGIMVSRYDELKEIPYMNMICDEAHYVKNSKSSRTRVLRSLVAAGVPSVLFLSGTPFMNRPSELFPLLNMLDPVGFGNFFSFAKQYCGAMYVEGAWFFPPNGATNLPELSDRLKFLMLRRTKREVLKELPELTRATLPVSMDNITEYAKARKDFEKWVHGEKSPSKDNILAHLTHMRQIIGKVKVPAAVELAESVLNGGKQVVLFAHHKEVVEELKQQLRAYAVGVISGDVPAKKRQELVNEFLSQDSYLRVMIITVAGAEGIDLFSASDIIFVEREWNPAKEEQAESRLHRNGQKNAVTAWYLVVSKTLDEKMDKLVKTKRETFKQVITSDEILELVLGE